VEHETKKNLDRSVHVTNRAFSCSADQFCHQPLACIASRTAPSFGSYTKSAPKAFAVKGTVDFKTALAGARLVCQLPWTGAAAGKQNITYQLENKTFINSKSKKQLKTTQIHWHFNTQYNT